MSIIAWIVMGLIAGFAASKLVEHRGKGLLLDIVLGVAGALVGGFMFRLIGSPGITGFNLWSVFVSMMGAVILLGISSLFSRRRWT